MSLILDYHHLKFIKKDLKIHTIFMLASHCLSGVNLGSQLFMDHISWCMLSKNFPLSFYWYLSWIVLFLQGEMGWHRETPIIVTVSLTKYLQGGYSLMSPVRSASRSHNHSDQDFVTFWDSSIFIIPKGWILEVKVFFRGSNIWVIDSKHLFSKSFFFGHNDYP